MIKVLRLFDWKRCYGWIEVSIAVAEGDEESVPFDALKKKVKPLRGWIEELVDKDHWKIIAATTEYIILQKPNYLRK